MNRRIMPQVRARRTISEAVAGTPFELSDEDRKINALYARLFSGEDGQAVLAHFRHVTIENVLGAEPSDGALREREAERRFVRRIENRITRHFEEATRPAEGTRA